MSKHAPEPWYFYENDSYCEINSERDGQIGDSCASSCLGNKELGIANAMRIVGRVDACVGMDDPAAEIEKLRRQRDELLDSVKRARLEWLDQNQTLDDTDVVTPYDHVLYRGDC